MYWWGLKTEAAPFGIPSGLHRLKKKDLFFDWKM